MPRPGVGMVPRIEFLSAVLHARRHEARHMTVVRRGMGKQGSCGAGEQQLLAWGAAVALCWGGAAIGATVARTGGARYDTARGEGEPRDWRVGTARLLGARCSREGVCPDWMEKRKKMYVELQIDWRRRGWSHGIGEWAWLDCWSRAPPWKIPGAGSLCPLSC